MAVREQCESRDPPCLADADARVSKQAALDREEGLIGTAHVARRIEHAGLEGGSHDGRQRHQDAHRNDATVTMRQLTAEPCCAIHTVTVNPEQSGVNQLPEASLENILLRFSVSLSTITRYLPDHTGRAALQLSQLRAHVPAQLSQANPTVQ